MRAAGRAGKEAERAQVCVRIAAHAGFISTRRLGPYLRAHGQQALNSPACPAPAHVPAPMPLPRCRQVPLADAWLVLAAFDGCPPLAAALGNVLTRGGARLMAMSAVYWAHAAVVGLCDTLLFLLVPLNVLQCFLEPSLLNVAAVGAMLAMAILGWLRMTAAAPLVMAVNALAIMAACTDAMSDAACRLCRHVLPSVHHAASEAIAAAAAGTLPAPLALLLVTMPFALTGAALLVVLCGTLYGLWAGGARAYLRLHMRAASACLAYLRWWWQLVPARLLRWAWLAVAAVGQLLLRLAHWRPWARPSLSARERQLMDGLQLAPAAAGVRAALAPVPAAYAYHAAPAALLRRAVLAVHELLLVAMLAVCLGALAIIAMGLHRRLRGTSPCTGSEQAQQGRQAAGPAQAEQRALTQGAPAAGLHTALPQRPVSAKQQRKQQRQQQLQRRKSSPDNGSAPEQQPTTGASNQLQPPTAAQVPKQPPRQPPSFAGGSPASVCGGSTIPPAIIAAVQATEDLKRAGGRRSSQEPVLSQPEPLAAAERLPKAPASAPAGPPEAAHSRASAAPATCSPASAKLPGMRPQPPLPPALRPQLQPRPAVPDAPPPCAPKAANPAVVPPQTPGPATQQPAPPAAAVAGPAAARAAPPQLSTLSSAAGHLAAQLPPWLADSLRRSAPIGSSSAAAAAAGAVPVLVPHGGSTPRQEPAPAAADAPQPEAPARLCVVCSAAPCQAGFLHAPTIHCVACTECAASFKPGDPCPLAGCGVPIKRVMRVFTV